MVAPSQDQPGHGSVALPNSGHGAQRVGNVFDGLQLHSLPDGRISRAPRSVAGANQFQGLGGRRAPIQPAHRTGPFAQKATTAHPTVAKSPGLGFGPETTRPAGAKSGQTPPEALSITNKEASPLSRNISPQQLSKGSPMKTSPPKIERLTKRHAGQTYPLDSAEKPPIFKKQAD